MDSRSESLEWVDIFDYTFDNIKNIHDAAYKSIEAAITLEENEKPFEALEKYKEGIEFIDQALSIPVSCSSTESPTWQKACSLIHKLKQTRAEVLTRINFLKVKYECGTTSTITTSSQSSEGTLRTYKDLASELTHLSVRDFTNSDVSIIYINNQAKLYYISPDGTVLSTSDYQELKIYKIEGGIPDTFLQVGDWIYPLVPGVSPCYKTEYHGFIFPDINSNVRGSSIGIIVPGDADEFLDALLTNILHGVIHHEFKPSTLTEKISSGIVSGAGYLARGLIFGAENIGKLLNYGTPKIINSINPAMEPTQMPNAVSQGLKLTQTATNKTAKITGYVANSIGTATSKLGKFLAPHIERQGSRLLQLGFNCSEAEASSKMKGALTIAAGAVEGFATIYHGLETSSSILGKNLKDNTVKIVKHKYGSPIGEATLDTLNTVGNVVSISEHAAVIKPKNLIRKTAKEAIVSDNN